MHEEDRNVLVRFLTVTDFIKMQMYVISTSC
jgi:hypothetical protein